MDVPQIVRVPTKRSKRQSNGVIQKIPKFEEPKTTPTPDFFYDRFKKNKTGDEPQLPFRKQYSGLDLWLQQQIVRNKEPWPIPRQHHLTQYNVKPNFLENFTFPSFPPPTVNWDEVTPRRSPATIWATSTLIFFFILLGLKLCVSWHKYRHPAPYNAQRRLSLEQQLAAGRLDNDPVPYDADSMTLSVTSGASILDMPPSYAEVTSNSGVANKDLDLVPEDSPPPYSVCQRVADLGRTNDQDNESLWVGFSDYRSSQTTIEIGDLTK